MNPSIAIEKLAVRLGQRDVLRDITFAARPGELVAVLGPNGSGKSTLIRSLIGLVPLARGQVRIAGAAPGACAAGAIGYVPQIKSMDRTFPAQAIELVASVQRNAWPGRLDAARRDWSLKALRRVGAEHLADRQVSELSGGELQRVYLARALATDVQVLILDEPETGIDAAGTSDLYALLESYCSEQQGTVLLVTHDWDAAMHHASKVLLLKQTQISFGTPAVALAEEHVRAAFGHVGHAHGVTGA
ncbi:MAG: metal ABC transporter ATP-binding protein [Rhodothermales bacterium]|nr:metal ABC transporter ATP-binding protein [Rhodothermales bacterium]